MGKQWKQWQILFSWAPKITVDGDWIHEIKKCLLLGRKAMTKLDSVLKIRNIILQTKMSIVKAMVFPVVMYRCMSWTIKKTESRRFYAFKLRCWRRLLRVPWTARRSNKSILKEISTEYSLEKLMLSWNSNTLAAWCRVDSLEKALMLGKIEGGRMDWFDLLAVQGTLKSLLQHRSLKASVLWGSAFFTVQLSHPYMTPSYSDEAGSWFFC